MEDISAVIGALYDAQRPFTLAAGAAEKTALAAARLTQALDACLESAWQSAAAQADGAQAEKTGAANRIKTPGFIYAEQWRVTMGAPPLRAPGGFAAAYSLPRPADIALPVRERERRHTGAAGARGGDFPADAWRAAVRESEALAKIESAQRALADAAVPEAGGNFPAAEAWRAGAAGAAQGAEAIERLGEAQRALAGAAVPEAGGGFPAAEVWRAGAAGAAQGAEALERLSEAQQTWNGAAAQGGALPDALAQTVQTALPAISALVPLLAGAAAAQSLFNASLLASPLGAVAAAVLAVIGLVAASAAVLSAVTGTAVSAAGLLGAVFLTALAFVGNLFIALWNTAARVFALLYNLVATVANFIGSVFTDPVNAVARLFFSLADTVLGVLETLAGAVDDIFGSNLSAAVRGWRDSLGAWTQKQFGQEKTVMERLDPDALLLERIDYGAAAQLGYDIGAALEGFQSGPLLNTGAGFDMQGQRLLLVDGGDDGVKSTLRRIAGTTRAIHATQRGEAEDLEYLRDAAEAAAINRFTTAQIRIEQTNNNTIARELDIDGIISRLTGAVGEALSAAAEGVYA